MEISHSRHAPFNGSCWQYAWMRQVFSTHETWILIIIGRLFKDSWLDAMHPLSYIRPHFSYLDHSIPKPHLVIHQSFCVTMSSPRRSYMPKKTMRFWVRTLLVGICKIVTTDSRHYLEKCQRGVLLCFAWAESARADLSCRWGRSTSRRNPVDNGQKFI